MIDPFFDILMMITGDKLIAVPVHAEGFEWVDIVDQVQDIIVFIELDTKRLPW